MNVSFFYTGILLVSFAVRFQGYANVHQFKSKVEKLFFLKYDIKGKQNCKFVLILLIYRYVSGIFILIIFSAVVFCHETKIFFRISSKLCLF